jgi:hypothetical protein
MRMLLVPINQWAEVLAHWSRINPSTGGGKRRWEMKDHFYDSLFLARAIGWKYSQLGRVIDQDSKDWVLTAMVAEKHCCFSIFDPCIVAAIKEKHSIITDLTDYGRWLAMSTKWRRGHFGIGDTEGEAICDLMSKVNKTYLVLSREVNAMRS